MFIHWLQQFPWHGALWLMILNIVCKAAKSNLKTCVVCLENKCKGILVKAAVSKTQLSSLNPFFLEDFQEDWTACKTELIYSYYLLQKSNFFSSTSCLKNKPLYPIINQVPMSLLKTLHIQKPGSMWALDFWSCIKGRQMMCQVCYSERQEKTNFQRSRENQTHNKTHPSLDENFFQILHLAQFDLGSHKWIKDLRCRDVFKSVSSFLLALDPYNQVKDLHRG